MAKLSISRLGKERSHKDLILDYLCFILDFSRVHLFCGLFEAFVETFCISFDLYG